MTPPSHRLDARDCPKTTQEMTPRGNLGGPWRPKKSSQSACETLLTLHMCKMLPRLHVQNATTDTSAKYYKRFTCNAIGQHANAGGHLQTPVTSWEHSNDGCPHCYNEGHIQRMGREDDDDDANSSGQAKKASGPPRPIVPDSLCVLGSPVRGNGGTGARTFLRKDTTWRESADADGISGANNAGKSLSNLDEHERPARKEIRCTRGLSSRWAPGLRGGSASNACPSGECHRTNVTVYDDAQLVNTHFMPLVRRHHLQHPLEHVQTAMTTSTQTAPQRCDVGNLRPLSLFREVSTLQLGVDTSTYAHECDLGASFGGKRIQKEATTTDDAQIGASSALGTAENTTGHGPVYAVHPDHQMLRTCPSGVLQQPSEIKVIARYGKVRTLVAYYEDWAKYDPT